MFIRVGFTPNFCSRIHDGIMQNWAFRGRSSSSSWRRAAFIAIARSISTRGIPGNRCRSARARKGKASIVIPNRLQGQFNPDAHDEHWVTNITYIRTYFWWRCGVVITKNQYGCTLIREVNTQAMSGSLSWNHMILRVARVVAVTAMTMRLQKAFSSYWNVNG